MSCDCPSNPKACSSANELMRGLPILSLPVPWCRLCPAPNNSLQWLGLSDANRERKILGMAAGRLLAGCQQAASRVLVGGGNPATCGVGLLLVTVNLVFTTCAWCHQRWSLIGMLEILPASEAWFRTRQDLLRTSTSSIRASSKRKWESDHFTEYSWT
jgi:hypothetical protein